MKQVRVLVIGGGIGGLTAAIALLRKGHSVDLIERETTFQVQGVGIIQQANVIRAVGALGVLDAYINAGFGFDFVSVFGPDGALLARMPTPRLLDGYPSNLGITRRALHEVLAAEATKLGCKIRFGLTADSLEDDGATVRVILSDGREAFYDIVVGADGLKSTTRTTIFPDAAGPAFTGQGVWRYGFPRPDGLDGIHTYHGKVGVGLVPLAKDYMYMFATTAESEKAHYPHETLAKTLREKLSECPPAIQEYAAAIKDNDAVVYRPLEWVLLTGPWHRGRIVLLGDAVHATTPHLGQGAGLAIEDSLVLADELTRADSPEAAFTAYRDRRVDRVKFIVETSLALGRSQLGTGPRLDQGQAIQQMYGVISQPI